MSSILIDSRIIIIDAQKAGALQPYIAEAHLRRLSWEPKLQKFLPRDQERVSNTGGGQEIAAIEQLKTQLERDYGIRISVDLPEELRGSRTADTPSQEEFQRSLRTILGNLEKYPQPMLLELRNISICIVSNLRRIDGKKLGGETYYPSYILLDASDTDLTAIIDHELFHFFDQSTTDNPLWAEANPGGLSEYTYKNGQDAISYEGSTWNSEDPAPPGYADPYGKAGGPNEDQALIAENLLSPVRADRLLKRAVTDEVLRAKMEMLTGCFFDPTKRRFTRILSGREYRVRFGFPQKDYYYRWAGNGQQNPETGAVEMGPEFWNSISGRS